MKGEAPKCAAPSPASLVDFADPAARAFLVVRVQAGSHVSENTHHFVPLKSVDLPRAALAAAIRQSGGGFALRITADAPAFHVELSAGRLPGIFSDNIFTVIPGRDTLVDFKPALPTTLATLRRNLALHSVRDTY